MKRRKFLQEVSAQALATISALTALDGKAIRAADPPNDWIDPATAQDWEARWEKMILEYASRKRWCDTAISEELGWRVSPFLNGYYYGYLVTHDAKWVERFVDWTDSCLKRAVKEPDGYLGWPELMDMSLGFDSDSILGEAMLLRPVVAMADEILKTPALKTQWGGKAESYLEFAERTFEKWDSRDAWHNCAGGGVWVVQYFGIDSKTNAWTEGYARRKTKGFTEPDNKQNQISRWLINLYDVTKKPIYRERAEQWWKVQRLRMKTREDGKYFIWNYWDPAGPWDYKPDGTPIHWSGITPNGGYYADDLEGIVAAYQHQLVFSRQDIDRLISTNRDYMWNQQIEGAKFQRIDGGPTDPRWPNAVGLLWDALIPYDETLRRIFVANHKPGGNWGSLSRTPWFLSLARQH